MGSERFSLRHGAEPDPVEITIRHEAPEELRRVVIDTAYNAGLSPYAVRTIISPALRYWPDFTRKYYLETDAENRQRMRECEWYEVYEAIEAIHNYLMTFEEKRDLLDDTEVEPDYYEVEINRYFRRQGIGWKLTDGVVEIRGSEPFESVVAHAQVVLEKSNRPTAQNELHEALRDMSRRPKGDLTGALQHAFAALECVARDVIGDRSSTLGKILRRHPGLIPRPLDTAVEKLWGFVSGQARHLSEGQELDEAEVELAVAVSAATATFLIRRWEKFDRP